MPTLTATSVTHPTQHLSAPAQIRIVADDLTGAADSAAAFLAAGHSVRIWLGPEATAPALESVQAFHTASRDLPAQQAAAAVFQATAALASDRPTLLFKKVDSAGRGHLAAELLAAHRALGTRAILFAPSFPAAGRTVRGGILHLEDSAGTQRQLPLVPLFQDHALTAQISFPSQISNALAFGAQVLVCDAHTQAELNALAAHPSANLLYAGSAGFARALSTRYAGPHATRSEPLPRNLHPLTICGTLHPVTQRQLDHLAAAIPHAARLRLRVQPSDATHILHHFHHHEPDALILTGGDTAQLVLTTLGAHSILLRGELAPGIPWGIVQGGRAHNRIVITKSGGFGAADALTRTLHQLSGTRPA